MLMRSLREELIYYGRQMLMCGLTVHTGGNLSVRDPETGLIAIKPTSRPYDRLRPEDIPILDPEGKVIEGQLRPSSEWPMHTMIYRVFPRAGAVVHCHSPYVLAAAAAGKEIPLINHEICMHCSSPVRVVPFEIPGTEALAESAIRGFGTDNNVTILGNHGSIAYGATLWHAYDAVCAVEQAAQTLHLSMAFCGGKEPSPIPEEGRRALRACDPLRKPDDGKPPVIHAV